MNIEQREDKVGALLQECISILEIKGKAYAGEEDSLANFKRNAERLGLTKYQVWSVYFGKHIDSIFNAIKDSPKYPIDHSEGMKGRIIDAINYLSILHCLLYEDSTNETK